MKQIMSIALTFGLVATTYLYSFAHGGEHHKLMGTIDSVSQTEVVVVDPQHESHMVRLGPATRYLRSTGEGSNRADLDEGMRVVVTFAPDGSGAAEIRFASVGENHDNDSESGGHADTHDHGDTGNEAHEHGHESGHGHSH